MSIFDVRDVACLDADDFGQAPLRQAQRITSFLDNRS